MTKRVRTTIDRELILALRADADHSPGSAVRARVFARIENRIAALAAPVSVAASVAVVASESAAAAASTSSAATPAAAPSLLVSALSKPIGVALLSATLGGASTYALGEYLEPSATPHEHSASGAARANVPSRIAPVTSPRSAPAAAAAAKTSQEPTAPARVARQPEKGSAFTASPTVEPSAEQPAAVPGLGEQQALLDSARTALARGESRAVLETLTAHSARYPESDLAEEREALAIKALVLAGQHDAAKQRGARFKQRFPNSLLLSSITAALAAIP